MKIAILGASRHNVGGNVSTTAAGVAEARTAEHPGFERPGLRHRSSRAQAAKGKAGYEIGSL